MKKYYTYIATNKNNTVLYTGMTNDLERRMREHKNNNVSSFCSKYNINKLIYFEEFSSPGKAIETEKKIKGWKREKKEALIDQTNPDRDNLLD